MSQSILRTSNSNLLLLAAAVLDVLWIAAAAYTTDKFNPVQDFCKLEQSNPAVPNLHLACSTIQASMAFSYLNFVIRVYPLFLIVPM